MVAGRSEGDLLFEDTELSGRHCRFFLEENKWHFEDLGSTNGSLVNGAEQLPNAPPHLIGPFHVVIFGSQIIVVLDQQITKIKDRQQLLDYISKNCDNKYVFEAIKKKSVFFMKAKFPQMVLRIKVARLEHKIDLAKVQKQQKLILYDQKAEELLKKKELIDQKVKQLALNKSKMGNQIDAQIEPIVNQLEVLQEELMASESSATSTSIKVEP